MLGHKRRVADYIDDEAEEEEDLQYRHPQRRVRWDDEYDEEGPPPPQHRLLPFAPQEDDESDNEDEEERRPPRVSRAAPCADIEVLSIHVQGQNCMAAAFLDSKTRRLQILEDTKDTWAWDLSLLRQLPFVQTPTQLTTVCEQCLPEQILISVNAPDSLVDAIDQFCESPHLPFPHLTAGKEFPQCSSVGLPPREFHHTLAQYRLANVRLPRNESALHRQDGEGEEDEEEQREEDDELDKGAGLGRMRLSLLKMGSRVNVDAPCAVSPLSCSADHQVSAAGALISYITRLESTAGGDDASLDLNVIESMDL